MSELPHDEAIARYQAALLDLLAAGTDGRQMADQLHAAAATLGADLGTLDDTLVEVAADLTRTWGRAR